MDSTTKNSGVILDTRNIGSTSSRLCGFNIHVAYITPKSLEVENKHFEIFDFSGVILDIACFLSKISIVRIKSLLIG